MSSAVDRMLAQLGSGGQPPVHLWHPELSGDIDIRIASNGDWFHEGSQIKRQELVRLFASILRYEPDCGHVLVTPVEKWRIKVDGAPLQAVAIDIEPGTVRLVTNTGEDFDLGPEHPLEITRDQAGNQVPEALANRGLKARLARPVYYELAEHCEQRGELFGIESGGVFFSLSAPADH